MWQRFVDWLSRRRFTLVNLEIENVGNDTLRIQVLDENGDPCSPILVDWLKEGTKFTLGPLFLEFDNNTELEVLEN